MIRWAAFLIPALYVFFTYWISGGDFSRSSGLAATFVMASIFGVASLVALLYCEIEEEL